MSHKNSPQSASSAHTGSGSQTAALLLMAVDVGLAGLLLVAPWFMGGRHPVGEFVYVALSVQIALCWLARQALLTMSSARGSLVARGRINTAWRWSGGEIILVAAVGLLVLQLMHLPSGLFASLAPHTAKILPLWNSTGQSSGALGAWDQISLTPDATRGALAMLISYCLLFIVAVQRIHDLADVERVFKCLALGVVLLAIVGLLQCFAGNGRFLWFYEHPFRDTYGVVKGPFINQNHFAHMLALGIGPLVWCLQKSIARKDTPAADVEFDGLRQWCEQKQVFGWSLGLGLVLFAGLMTLSRGGVAGMALASVLTCAAFYQSRMLSHRLVLSIAATFVLIGVALTIHGYTRVTERLGDYASGSLEKLDAGAGRRRIWQADFSASRDFARCGAGVGSHREIYPMYLTGTWETEWTHAENGYLQVALEAGAPGLLLLGVGILLIGRWCLAGMRGGSSTRVFLCAATVTAGFVVSVVHSCVDFVWYIPACMSVAVVLAACAVRVAQLANPQPNCTFRGATLSTGAACSALACTLLIGGWAVQNRLGPAMAAPSWDAYLRFALCPDAQAGKLAPDDSVFEALQDVVRWTPDDARAHVRLAGICLRRFEHLQKQAPNAMGLSQIRDAAIASRFPSRAALNTWLSVAVGNHRRYLDQALEHAKRGLACGPLQGEAYIYLAELCFLEGAQPGSKHALIQQALAVRPHNAKVQLAAGNEAVLSGDLEQAITHWRTAFHTSVEQRNQLIELMVAQHVPAEFLLEKFRPNLAALGAMYRAYGRVLPIEHLRPLLVRYAEEGNKHFAAADNAASDICLELASVHNALGQTGQAHAYLSRAAGAEPNNFDVRLNLARFLLEQRMFAEAEKQFEWCLQRRPNDDVLKEKLSAAVRGRVAAERSAAAPVGTFR